MPIKALLSVFVSAALLGVFQQAPASIGAMATLIFFVGAVIGALRGVRRYRRPERAEAIRLLDAQSDLRPLSSLMDRPAKPEPQGVVLWRSHEERLTDAARRLSAPSMVDKWSRIDPLRLRFILPAIVIGLFALSWGNSYERLSSALDPDYGSLLGADSIRIEAWVTPPEHTGRAPIFLKDEQSELRVPKGSVMTLRVQAPSTPKLRIFERGNRDTRRFEATPDGAYEIVTQIETSSQISVRWWGERKAWTMITSPDAPPEAEFVELPVLGEGDLTELAGKCATIMASPNSNSRSGLWAVSRCRTACRSSLAA